MKIHYMPDELEYHNIRENALNLYNQRENIRCPALTNEIVHFTSEGFNHLVYKGDRSERDKSVQILKFDLFPRALEIIGLTTTYQEYDEGIKSVRKKRFKKTVIESAIVKYWGLIAIIARLNSSQSLTATWKMTKTKNTARKRCP